MKKNKTLEQQAYDSIKQRIIAGTYKPGSHITEAILIEDLKMSRTPIRRALGKLESEGLLTHHSHHGSVVKNIRVSMIELLNMIEVQKIFVTVSIQKAERKQLSFNVVGMRDCLETMEWAYEHEKPESYYQAGNHFSDHILSVSNNDLIVEIAEEIRKRFMVGASESAFQLRKQGIPHTIQKLKEMTICLEQKNYSGAIEMINRIRQEMIKDLVL